MNRRGNVVKHSVQPYKVNRSVVATPPEGRVPTPSNHLSLQEYFSGEITLDFIGLEKTLLDCLVQVCEKNDDLPVNELVEAQNARNSIKKHGRTLEPNQERLRIGVQGFREFMKNGESLNAWCRSTSVFRTIFRQTPRGGNSDPLVNDVFDAIGKMRRSARVISEHLEEAGEDLRIEPETKDYIRIRWFYLHDISRLVKEGTARTFGQVPPWSTISELIRTGPTQTQDLSLGSSSTSKLSNTTSILWLTALVTLVTIPTAGRAWQYSDHKPGTTKQADFWYLLQNCSMALLNLTTLAIPVWRRQAFPAQSWAWTWGFIALAVVCAVVAPVLYSFVPTEWSAYMAIVAGIIQAFMTLQIALVADSAGAKIIKKD